MYHKSKHKKFYILPTIFIYLLYVSRNNIEVFPIQPWMTGFYNRGGKCLLRGTTCAFQLNGPRFVLKWFFLPPFPFFSHRHLLQFRFSLLFSFVFSSPPPPSHRSDQVANWSAEALRPDSLQGHVTFLRTVVSISWAVLVVKEQLRSRTNSSRP